jgi:exodeoxyribonuclease VIII
MKYFKVMYVSQKTLHPDGYKTFSSFVASETKHAAKLKALAVLSEQDPACCMMYKVPRLDEISEDEYYQKTKVQLNVQAIDQYCALLAIFGEQDEYDSEERRDADDLLACPEDEPEVYAEYLPLRRQVTEAMAGMPKAICLAEVQTLALHLYRGDLSTETVGKYVNSVVGENSSVANKQNKQQGKTSFDAGSTLTSCANSLLSDLAHSGELAQSNGDEKVINRSEMQTSTIQNDLKSANSLNSYLAPNDSMNAPGDQVQVSEQTLDFLSNYPPVNGLIENKFNGSDLTIDALNQRLSEITNGGSLTIAGLNNATYHACDGYSSTQIRLVQSSGPAALEWYKRAPRCEKDSSVLSFGTAVHTAILEPGRFHSEFVSAPAVNLRTKEGKEELAVFEAKCAGDGSMSIKADDYAKVCLMRDSALAHPTVSELLQNGIAELSIFYRTEGGVLLKVRPDWLGEFGGAPFLLDIKTTNDIHDFGKSVEKYGYHVQAAFYSTVVGLVFGMEVDFAFCAITKTQECGRHPVLLGMLDEVDAKEGLLQVRESITLLEKSAREGVAASMATITRPWWARRSDKKRCEGDLFGEQIA